ncbi:MAG TPA: hypothetical protein ENO19_07365 [Halothiobacillaceae bacterium]|nr:hypothetical protein [Halothiobacillaceae bacterium]
MSEYRDWLHAPGGSPETAPERLVDVFTAPWLQTTAGPADLAGVSSSTEGWLLGLVLFTVLLVLLGGLAWRCRREWRLGLTLARLERAARRADRSVSVRALQDRAVIAIARWQHGGVAPRRDRLPPSWAAWVRRLDHQRFAPDKDDPRQLADELRRMRQTIRWRGGAR